MKVKILMNKVSWDVRKELLEVKKWFSKYVDLEFEVEAMCLTKIEWQSNKQGLKKYWVEKVLIDDTATIYVLNLPKYQWEADHLGFAPLEEFRGQKLIAMTSSVNGRRKLNKGWMSDNEFAGRLRHELCHTFYQLTGEDESRGKTWKTHILESDRISLVLKDIKWENLSTQN